jgi:hypothetical protein
MDAAALSSGLDVIAPACGQTLSVSEKAAVETSLAVLKADNGFDTVKFWGRINGIAADYLIAQGYNLPYAMIDAAISPAVSFYRCETLLRLFDKQTARAAACAPDRCSDVAGLPPDCSVVPAALAPLLQHRWRDLVPAGCG